MFNVHPYSGKWSDLTNIFRWVETTNLLGKYFEMQITEDAGSQGGQPYMLTLGDPTVTFARLYPGRGVHPRTYGNMFENQNLPWKLTAIPWSMLVGRLFFFELVPFQGTFVHFGLHFEFCLWNWNHMLWLRWGHSWFQAPRAGGVLTVEEQGTTWRIIPGRT